MTTIFLLIVALHNGLPPQEMGAFHHKDACVELGREIGKVPGNQMSVFECKEILLSPR
jgi:hypothetical protein